MTMANLTNALVAEWDQIQAARFRNILLRIGGLAHYCNSQGFEMSLTIWSSGVRIIIRSTLTPVRQNTESVTLPVL